MLDISVPRSGWETYSPFERQRDIPLPSEIEKKHLFYQPILWRTAEFPATDMVSFEQLLRFPGHNAQELITKLHAKGYGNDAELVILYQVCDQMAQWKHAQGIEPRIAVNLSTTHFGMRGVYPMDGDGLVAFVNRTVEETNVDPSRLEIEFTEYNPIYDEKSAAETMQRLQQMSITVKADDVGIDYNSDVDRVLRLPYNTIKLDKYFTEQVGKDGAVEDQACSIVEAAHERGMLVVAENVDSDEKLRFFDDVAHCDGFQGWHFSKAVPAHAVTPELMDNVIGRGTREW